MLFFNMFISNTLALILQDNVYFFIYILTVLSTPYACINTVSSVINFLDSYTHSYK